MVESTQSKHAEVIQRLAPQVLDGQTMSRLLATDPKSRTHDEFELVRALEQEFNAPANRLFKILGADFTERQADEDVAVTLLLNIEQSAKESREPQVTQGMATIQALAPKVLATTTLLDLVSRGKSTRSPDELNLLEAIRQEFGLTPLGIAGAMNSPPPERTQQQRQFLFLMSGLHIDAALAKTKEVPEIPQFLKDGQTIREALKLSCLGSSVDLTNPTTKFLLAMVETLETSFGDLDAALTKDLGTCSNAQTELRAKFSTFEERWQKIVDENHPMTPNPDPEKPQALVLTELQMSKLDVLYWKREALRLQYQGALEVAKEVRSEVSCVEQDFEVLAASLALDTTRHFSWDAEGNVTYQDAENKSPIRPKGK